MYLSILYKKNYHCLIHPYLTYGISIWGQADKTILNSLLVLQKRVIRLINHAHDIINNSLPLNIADLFMEIGDVHNYNTISAAGKNLYQPQTRLNLSYKPFSSIGVNVWNSLSPFIRSLSNFLFEKE